MGGGIQLGMGMEIKKQSGMIMEWKISDETSRECK